MPEYDLRLRTKSFALSIIRLYTTLPKREEAQVIGKQVLRSATSVGSNYREAYRARSDAEFLAKLGDCLKELDETAFWLELLVESNIMPPPRMMPLLDETDQLIAIFTTIVKKKKG
jgi:four helix bundle protein